VQIQGWAASVRTRRPADFVLAFAGGRFLAAVPLIVDRPKVARLAGASAVLTFGYTFQVPLSRVEHRGKLSHLQIFGVDRQVASPLPFQCVRRQDLGCRS
jgi:hypothetical protein